METKEKLVSLLIDKVSNGFILHLNENPMGNVNLFNKMVFNTKEQLKDFIDESF